MLILDENVIDDERQELLRRGLKVRQVGHEIGKKGTSDPDVRRLLQRLPQPTLITRDQGFFDRRFCHRRYCIIVFVVEENELADFTVRILRHRAFASRSQRMGKVIQVSPAVIQVYELGHRTEYLQMWRSRGRRDRD